ncbi:MAG: nucleotidyltransferase domain-containing protein [Elusimicrobia bacterium]|nr:nucleotidyltransferase domain-containing protein [Elusimicrobiota bacterium]
MNNMRNIFGSRLRRRLLAYCFEHAGEAFHVRGLAARLDEDPGNLSRELARLSRDGLFSAAVIGSMKRYSLNRQYPLFDQFREILTRTEGAVGQLQRLCESSADIERAFIHGSFARLEHGSPSDIDVVLVGEVPSGHFLRELGGLEKRLGREINYTSYTPAEFATERKKRGGFLDLVLKGKIVVLKGNPRG